MSPSISSRRKSEDVQRKSRRDSTCLPTHLPPIIISPRSPQKSPTRNYKSSRRKSLSITNIPILPSFLGAKRKVRNGEKLRDSPVIPQVRELNNSSIILYYTLFQGFLKD